ncbi:hypothetical protein [Saccharothrix sp. HUAS TT1]|uniref:hypothetical protein n=1 Tax=unclassified Saccharothrix TaxID=2593673 RepID=UPI00345B76B7
MLDSSEAREVLHHPRWGEGPADAVLAAIFALFGVLASAYGLHTAAHLSTEETTSRLDPVLATPTTHTRWAASHLVVAFTGTALLVLTAGLAAGVVHATRAGDPSKWAGSWVPPRCTSLPSACSSTSPPPAAAWPRLTAAAWAALAGSLLLTELGPLLELDPWPVDLLPFAHTSKLPGAAFTTTPVLALHTTAAAVPTAAGLLALRRRDIA